jgi:hypothetical protein
LREDEPAVTPPSHLAAAGGKPNTPVETSDFYFVHGYIDKYHTDI